ncbi:MAG: exo-alpha-sialidase, partial [Chlorobi bacterium]|nr:exo-alpha-sialidase [Chlorobiota bacterium]
MSAVLFWGTNQNESDSIQNLTKSQIYKANAEYFRQMFHDPETGEIPEGIRQRELLHAELFDQEYDLKHNKSLSDDEKDMIWYEAGPNDVGGRTRALAVHCEDSDLIIAGGVSGGIWKSSDRGASWHLKSDISHSHSVSALAQDTRIGHTNVWYYGTGEFTKNSVTDLTFRENYYGNGIYKSTNEGETWRLLENAKSKYAGGDDRFNFISRLAVSPKTGTIFAAANNYGILRSDDEGESFYVALGGNDNYRYSDVSVASDGTVYAVLSEYGTNHARRVLPGVWKSTDDGNYFENITPNDFPSKHERSVIAVAPSNPEVVYVLTYTGLVNDYNTNDIRLFYINTGTGVSEDRTVNLPLVGGYTSILNAQGGYNLLISVKPDDENFVLVGGTNLYRSFDGFQTKPSDMMESWIAGYHPRYYKYPGQHPDLHICAFVPDEPNKMWSGHDGGLSYCDDITAATNDSTDLKWTNMNNGYNVTQFYNVAMADNPRDFRLICGSQDNGSPYFISNGQDIGESRDISGGDGAFAHIGENYAFSSVYFGRVLRHPYDEDDNPKNGSLVSPAAAKGELFFNPYVVDPLDDEIMYFPSGRQLWRNIEMHAPNNEVRDKWEQMSGFEIPPGYSITAINVSKNNPHNLLYFAASSRWDNPMKPIIFRMENANNELADVIEVSIPDAPRGAHISSIAISPHNGDEMLVTMSNYNV